MLLSLSHLLSSYFVDVSLHDHAIARFEVKGEDWISKRAMVAVVANKYLVTELLRLKALGMEVNNGGHI